MEKARMLKRFARPSTIALAIGLLFGWAEAVPCAAQTSPSAAVPAPSPLPPIRPVQSGGESGAPARETTIPPPRVFQVPGESNAAAGGGPQGSRGFEYGMELKPAPLEPSDLKFPINLATALRLSDARPLVVAAAQAGVWVAEAQLTHAKVLWVPMFVFGADYIRHDGGGPDFNKGIMTAPSVNFFYSGAAADLYVSLTDAYFEPLVARQVLNARQFDIQSARTMRCFRRLMLTSGYTSTGGCMPARCMRSSVGMISSSASRI